MTERDQLHELAAQSAGQREAWFGVPVLYLGKKFRASGSSRKKSRKLEESGFELAHDCIVRVFRATNPGFSPELGKLITVDGEEFRIQEILDHPTNPEYRLGLATPD